MSPSSSTDSSSTFKRQPSIQIGHGKTFKKKTATHMPLSKESNAKLHVVDGMDSPDIGLRSERESNKSKSSRTPSSMKSDSSIRHSKELHINKSGKFAPTTVFRPKNLTFNLIGSGRFNACLLKFTAIC